MTGINRRNCLKVLAGGVLGLPAAIAGETAGSTTETETVSPERPCGIFEPRDGRELLLALSEARAGDWIIIRSRTYDCRLHTLWVPPGVRVSGSTKHGPTVIRCLSIGGGRGSKLFSVWLRYSDRPRHYIVGPDQSGPWIKHNRRQES